MTQHYLHCNCSSISHLVRFWYDEDDKEEFKRVPLMSIEVCADASIPFYERIWRALKYVFNFQNLTYNEVIVTEQQIADLEDFLQEYRND